MTKTIDALSSATGWAGTASAPVANEYSDYIAGYNTQSLVFTLGAAQYLEKTFPTAITVTGYADLSLSCWGRDSTPIGNDGKVADYTIRLDITDDSAMPVVTQYLFKPVSEFSQIIFKTPSITSIKKIRFTNVSTSTQYFISSNMTTYTDQFPLDVFSAAKAGIEAERIYMSKTALAYPIGNVTVVAGDKTIAITGKWVDKYSVIQVGADIYQLGENEDGVYGLAGRFSGSSIVTSYTAEPAYLYIPIDWGMSEKEIALPSITLWGMNPDPILRSTKLDRITDTFLAAGGLQERQDGQIQEYKILVDVEGRESHLDIIADLSAVVRNFIAKERLWINGIRHYIRPESSTWIDPSAEFDQIYKCQYEFAVEVKENIWNRIPTVRYSAETVDAAVQS